MTGRSGGDGDEQEFSLITFDHLKKQDPKLRALSFAVLAGFVTLLTGLWWVQVVSAGRYQTSLEHQSYRTVRIPAVRGRIVGTAGETLAENRPTYNISLYLEELRRLFETAANSAINNARAELSIQSAADEKRLGRGLTKAEKKKLTLTSAQRATLRQEARALVVSNVVSELSATLAQPVEFDAAAFERHYQARLALPFPVVGNLSLAQIARFQEGTRFPAGVDLEVLSTRVYPHGTLAAHVLGRLQRDDRSVEGEDAFFSYRLPDYKGLVGMEAVYDRELRGTAGAKSVLVNNVGYRQTENVWNPAQPGQNLVLTINTRIQEAAERALQSVYGPRTEGAVVVMDIQSGALLALASSPTLNPNHFVQGFPPDEWARINNLRAEINRATQERYAPGSIFKLIVGLAALESGMSPKEIHHAIPNPQIPSKAVFFVGRHPFQDTAPPGDYDFKRAMKLSSNSYFIAAGLRAGPERLVRMGQKFHLGELTGLMPRQETSGAYPSLERVRHGWTDGNTANMSIGQDPVLVTPLQMAVMTAAIANGGKVLWPRLADRLEPQDPLLDKPGRRFESGLVRSHLGVTPQSLSILKEAMLADVEDPDGTGWRAAVPGYRICGKTGTAQEKNLRNERTGLITWFASFAPYEHPRYAVVVMVEDGLSGGGTCAPVAAKVYQALRDYELGKTGPVARAG